MQEIWRPIAGSTNYEVSNHGRVKSLDRFVNNKGTLVMITGRVLKPFDRNGYLAIHMSHDGIITRHYIHRLVACEFIANEDRKPFVNHKNGIKTDNRVVNLEHVTNMENLEHAYETGLSRVDWSPCAVVQMSDDFDVIAEFKSMREASRILGIDSGSISQSCRIGTRAAGYRFAKLAA